MLQTLLCSRSTFCTASLVLLWILCSGQCDPDPEGCGPALPSTGSHCSTPCPLWAKSWLLVIMIFPFTKYQRGCISSAIYLESCLPALEGYFLFVGLYLKMCCQCLSWSVSAVCCFSSLNLSGLKFRSLIHFELIFAQGEKYGYNFILLRVDIQFCNHHLLKSLSIPRCTLLTHL